MTTTAVPTLYEWVGGIEALNRLTVRFYEHVAQDALLAPVFAHMGPDHPAHVAAFLAEVLGGPTMYSAEHGGHPHMIRQHLSRHLTQDKRRRWVELLLATADELAVPDDAEVGLGRGQGALHRRVTRYQANVGGRSRRAGGLKFVRDAPHLRSQVVAGHVESRLTPRVSDRSP